MFKCKYCGKEYDNRHSYIGHLSHHSKKSASITNKLKRIEVEKKCQTCNEIFIVTRKKKI